MPRTYVGLEEEAWDETGTLAEQVEQIHHAAAAYYRDFREWPGDISVLVGRSLPHGFKMSATLTYRSVPDSEYESYSWILIVSDVVRHDLDGERLSGPHRLICRLSGKVELLPASQVAALLDTQPVDTPPAKPNAAATGSSD